MLLRFLLLALLALPWLPATAEAQLADDQSVILASELPFAQLLERTAKAVQANGLILIARPSASAAAAGRGIKIPGNAVLLVFNNHLAVRLLALSVEAGYEAPLRLYVTEGAGGRGRLSYRKPSALLAAYGVAGLSELGQELDRLLAKIAQEAIR